MFAASVLTGPYTGKRRIWLAIISGATKQSDVDARLSALALRHVRWLRECGNSSGRSPFGRSKGSIPAAKVRPRQRRGSRCPAPASVRWHRTSRPQRRYRCRWPRGLRPQCSPGRGSRRHRRRRRGRGATHRSPRPHPRRPSLRPGAAGAWAGGCPAMWAPRQGRWVTAARCAKRRLERTTPRARPSALQPPLPHTTTGILRPLNRESSAGR